MPEDRRSNLYRGGNLKSRMTILLLSSNSSYHHVINLQNVSPICFFLVCEAILGKFLTEHFDLSLQMIMLLMPALVCCASSIPRQARPADMQP
jgi:hypothetical protein